jgi:hypothetical protein
MRSNMRPYTAADAIFVRLMQELLLCRCVQDRIVRGEIAPEHTAKALKAVHRMERATWNALVGYVAGKAFAEAIDGECE